MTAPPTPRPPPADPVPTFPRRIEGVAADGRRWELLTAPGAVTAVTTTGTIGEANVSERGERVIVELWADEPGVPAELTTELVTQAFAAPAVRPRRPVLVYVPRRDGRLLAQALRHVQAATTRAAGATCLIEGYVDDPASATLPRWGGTDHPRMTSGSASPAPAVGTVEESPHHSPEGELR